MSETELRALLNELKNIIKEAIAVLKGERNEQ